MRAIVLKRPYITNYALTVYHTKCIFEFGYFAASLSWYINLKLFETFKIELAMRQYSMQVFLLIIYAILISKYMCEMRGMRFKTISSQHFRVGLYLYHYRMLYKVLFSHAIIVSGVQFPSVSNSRLTAIHTPHGDVIKWKHFPRYWPFVWGIHRSPVNSPYKGQWHGALIGFFCFFFF